MQLAAALRRMGRRREAEVHARAAQAAFRDTHDLASLAECGVELACLLAERGDVTSARHILEESLRCVPASEGKPLHARARTVTLTIATVRNDPSEAALALDAAVLDGDGASAAVRWWRVRGDTDQALAIPPPRQEAFCTAMWHAERARAAFCAENRPLSVEEARKARDLCREKPFAEIALYASLILGVAERTSDADWRERMDRARASLFTEVFLGALEFDARRSAAQDRVGARPLWRTLRARSQELGYRPGADEAAGWLGE
jgi:hypothetical protein